MEAPATVEKMTQALDLVVSALQLLDEAEAPGDIGAHLDLVRERLSHTLELTRVSTSIARQVAERSAI